MILFYDQVLLGLSGVVLVMLSVLASVGFFSAIGVKSTLIIMEVIPFLVLAVSFIFICFFPRCTPENDLILIFLSGWFTCHRCTPCTEDHISSILLCWLLTFSILCKICWTFVCFLYAQWTIWSILSTIFARIMLSLLHNCSSVSWVLIKGVGCYLYNLKLCSNFEP